MYKNKLLSKLNTGDLLLNKILVLLLGLATLLMSESNEFEYAKSRNVSFDASLSYDSDFVAAGNFSGSAGVGYFFTDWLQIGLAFGGQAFFDLNKQQVQSQSVYVSTYPKIVIKLGKFYPYISPTASIASSKILNAVIQGTNTLDLAVVRFNISTSMGLDFNVFRNILIGIQFNIPIYSFRLDTYSLGYPSYKSEGFEILKSLNITLKFTLFTFLFR